MERRGGKFLELEGTEGVCGVGVLIDWLVDYCIIPRFTDEA